MQKTQGEINNLVKWQKAVVYADKQFMEVVNALKKGFSSACRTYQEAFKKLEAYGKRLGLSDQTRNTIRKQFANRTYSILQEAEKLGREHGPDKIWSAFKLWQKTKGK